MYIVGIAIVVLLSIALTVIAAGTLWWNLYAWRTPENLHATGFASDPKSTHLRFSLILPCRDEPEAVMSATVAALLAQRHPDFEIVLSIGHDDLPTLAIAEQIASGDPRISVSVDHHSVRTSPVS